MYIKIAERLKPYSHIPGASTVLPGSSYQIEAFPACLRIYDLTQSFPKLLVELLFDLQGPFKDFTLQNDLEKGEIRVWGELSTGLIRYTIRASTKDRGVRILFEKTPENGIKIRFNETEKLLHAKESLYLLSESIAEAELFSPNTLERLSLGNNKAQDWELINRRLDLTEILPIWHRLGLLVNSKTLNEETEGTLMLLKTCRAGLELNQPEKLAQLWTNLYQASMYQLLVPRLLDDQFQGFLDKHHIENQAVSPLILLNQAAAVIRKFFVRFDHSNIHLLPALPPEFHCGRLMDVQIKQGKLTMEWSKKMMRRLEIVMQEDAEIIFHFRHATQCRIRRNMNEKGKKVLSGIPIQLEKNTHYFFDNFN